MWVQVSPHPATGSVRRAARVSIARWNLEEAVRGGPLSPPILNILLDDLDDGLRLLVGKGQAGGVDAIAETGGGGAVGEEVA